MPGILSNPQTRYSLSVTDLRQCPPSFTYLERIQRVWCAECCQWVDRKGLGFGVYGLLRSIWTQADMRDVVKISLQGRSTGLGRYSGRTSERHSVIGDLLCGC